MRREHNGLHERKISSEPRHRVRHARLPWRHFSKLTSFTRHVFTVGGPRFARAQVAVHRCGQWFDTDHVVPLDEVK